MERVSFRLALVLVSLLLLSRGRVSAFQCSPVTRIPGSTQTRGRGIPTPQNHRGLLQHVHDGDRKSKRWNRFSSNWRSIKQTCGQRLRRKPSQHKTQQQGSTRKHILSVMGLMFATLLVRPVQVLAMGGGMGGARGPVTPMSQ